MAVISTIVAAVAAVTISQVAIAATVIGTTLSIVGAVTKNKLVSQIGMGIGLAGLVTGAAGAFGLFDPSTTLGSLVGASGGAEAAASTVGQVAGSVAPSTVGPVVPTIDPTSGLAITQYSSQLGPGVQGASGVVGLSPSTALNMPFAPGVDHAAQAAAFNPSQEALGREIVNRAIESSAFTAPPVPTDVGITGVSGVTAPPTPVNPIAPSAAPAPSVDTVTGGVGAIPAGANVSGYSFMSSSGGMNETLSAADKAKKAFEGLDPAVKYGLVAGTITAGAGALSGMFQGMSASERLEFDKYVNDQRFGLAQQTFNRATETPGVINFRRS